MKKTEIKMARYPHGFFDGGVFDCEILPTLTTSDFQNNNFLIEIYEDEE